MQTDRYPYHILTKPYDTIIIDVTGCFRPTRTLNTIIHYTSRVGIHPNYNIIWDFRRTEMACMDKEVQQSFGWKIACQKVHSFHQAVVCHRGSLLSQIQGITRNTSVSIRERTRYFLTLGHAVDWLGTLRSPDGRLAA